MKITLTIHDEETGKKISAETTIIKINEFYEKTKVNGLTQLLFLLIENFNKQNGTNIKTSLPNEVLILPHGKEW